MQSTPATTTTPLRTVKVAVIGSGLAGLTAAYRLALAPELDGVRFEVHLFEKASTLGMDAHSVSVSVPGPNGELIERRVDVPMRSFQGGYYPQLIALYKHLGVAFTQRDFSYSFSTLAASKHNPRIETTMLYNGASGRAGVGMPSSSLPPRGLVAAAYAYAAFALSTLLLLLLYLRLAFLSLPLQLPTHLSLSLHLRLPLLPPRTLHLALPLPALLPARPAPLTTLAEWTALTTPRSRPARALGLDARWRAFVADVLVPLFSAVCTAPAADVWAHPVEELLDYIYLTLGTHHYVVTHGVRDVVRRLAMPLPPARVHLATPVLGLEYVAPRRDSKNNNGGEPTDTKDGADARATITLHTAHDAVPGFAHVVLATQADHAARALRTYLASLPPSPPSSRAPARPTHAKPHPSRTASDRALARHRTLVGKQIAALERVRYVRTLVVTHTDAALLPRAARDRRDLNLVVSDAFGAAAPSLSSAFSSLGEEKDTAGQTEECEREWDNDAPDALHVPPTYAMATHVLPFSSGVYQTTNPVLPPARRAVLSAARLARAVVSRGGKGAVEGFWRVGAVVGDGEGDGNSCFIENENLNEDGYRCEDQDASDGAEDRERENAPWFRFDLDWTWEWEEGDAGRWWGCAGYGREADGLGPLQGAGCLSPHSRPRSRSRSSPRTLPKPLSPTHPSAHPQTQTQNKNHPHPPAPSPQPGIWLAGAYAHAGIPLLEGCVASARAVVERGVWASEGVGEGAVRGAVGW